MSVALLSATEQLALLTRRSISPVELAEEHIRRIERLNPALNAFVDFEAQRTRRKAALPHSGVLAGLPLSVKSSIAAKGLRCEVGSLLRQGEVASEDAVAVGQLRAAGACFLGTTNCPEFLMAYETDNRLYGRTNNPWDLTRTPGGSSGGESAAIACGLSAGGLGSDSGGSVREPAHFTGICSLKPTPGRISAQGHIPPCVGPFSSLGAIGPMARTAADVELLFSVVHERSTPYRRAALDDVRSLPVGWLELDSSPPVTPETRSALSAAVRELECAGFHTQPFQSKLLAEAQRLWRIFFIQCGAMFYAETVEGRRDLLSPIFTDFLHTGEKSRTPLTAGDLLRAWADTDLLRQRWELATRTVPILLTPVCGVPAFRHGERSWSVEGQTLGYWDAFCFTQWFNLLACPAAVVPVGFSPEGLPIGVQIAGRAGEDETVLAVAGVLDAAFGYRPPPLAL